MSPTVASDRSSRLLGVALVAAATLSWSLTGFFTRVLGTDLFTTLAGRSAFGVAFLVILFVAQEGRAAPRVFMSMGRMGVAQAIASVVCAFATIASLYNTSVADNAVIGATSPFAAAVLARIFLGERVPPRTIVAGLVSLVGVAIVVSGSLGHGRLFGDALAVVMMLAFAAMIVIARAAPSMPVAPPNILAVALNFVVAAPFAHLAGVAPVDWGLLAAFGFTNFLLAGTLFLAGSRRIPAAESALIVALDLVFGPSVVWAAFGEAPTREGLIGGAVVLAAVIGHVVAGARRAPVVAVCAEAPPVAVAHREA
ncbi:DMT family transporter [Pinisolibacter aquiterrae]|uniref:DMT family transporter n=1 Tax=Pinisolibacter aquiterrae TaxID=2815579 RepID=UPI001C3D5215|nr:DMT family transporter [Pinisolibacter aquiterrae]MBV5265599.1 DMT family transporter [Pinisolibacter aquiterrae]MCC8236835.1 DMT family transporter [Pinisolibacter aquiterrae]